MEQQGIASKFYLKHFTCFCFPWKLSENYVFLVFPGGIERKLTLLKLQKIPAKFSEDP